jgi:signal transduction histidine kinase
MTRRIITEHAGALVVTSEPGKGSAFTIRLPRQRT